MANATKVNMLKTRNTATDLSTGKLTYLELIESFYRPNGHQYTGGWQNGKQHGEGVLMKNGERKKWLWENGKRI